MYRDVTPVPVNSAVSLQLPLSQVLNWVDSKPANAVIGYSRDGENCPLAQATRDVLRLPGDYYVSVDGDILVCSAAPGAQVDRIETDFAVAAVTYDLDSTCIDPESDTGGIRVTAAQFKQVLFRSLGVLPPREIAAVA